MDWTRAGRDGLPRVSGMMMRHPVYRLLCVLTLAVGFTAAPAVSRAQNLLTDVVFDFADLPLDEPLELNDTQHVDPAHIPPTSSTWRGAVTDSLRLLTIEHMTRIAFQEKTRRELGGPFFQDYQRSVKWPRTWEDGDSWLVNYVGHPIHGAASGYIWLDHEDGAHDPTLGFSREYWTSRGRATAWALGYSLQFEFGPLSEASIGNVGLNEGTTGWVDHVVTPVGALGFIVAEDTLDRYLVTRIEGWTGNSVLRAIARMALNPSRTLSNAAQGRLPWFRVGRPLIERR